MKVQAAWSEVLDALVHWRFAKLKLSGPSSPLQFEGLKWLGPFLSAAVVFAHWLSESSDSLAFASRQLPPLTLQYLAAAQTLVGPLPFLVSSW